MKKQWVICFMLGALALACGGCGEKVQEESHVDEKTTIDYKDIPAFLESDFCKEMQKEGKKVYLPTWDAEKFGLVNVYTSHETSVFTFKDAQTGKVGHYQISYDDYRKSVEDFVKDKPEAAKDQIIKAEKDGVSYDVYLSALPYQENTEYNLYYIPHENVRVYIGTARSKTEEILADFDQFDLVSSDEWKAD